MYNVLYALSSLHNKTDHFGHSKFAYYIFCQCISKCKQIHENKPMVFSFKHDSLKDPGEATADLTLPDLWNPESGGFSTLMY